MFGNRMHHTMPGRPGVPGQVLASSLGPAGTKNEFKRIDEVVDPTTGRWVVRDSAPYDEKKENEDEYRDYCFVFKKKYEYNTPVVTTTIVIKSPVLKDACAEVIGVIPPVSFHTAQVEIAPKILLTFLPALCDHLEKLKAKESPSSKEETAASQLSTLLDFLKAEYASDLELLAQYLAHEEITYDLLWAILTPNKEYYTTDGRTGQPRAVLLKWATNMGPCYTLDCEYLESYGEAVDEKKTTTTQPSPLKQKPKKFGKAKYSGAIYGFQGAVKINSLNVFPMEYHDQAEEVKKMLVVRGKKWAEYDGMHHVAYTGIAYQAAGKRIYINGRAMVDKVTFRRIKPNWTVGLPVDAGTTNPALQSMQANPAVYGMQPAAMNQLMALQMLGGTTKPYDPKTDEVQQRLTDDDYMLATPIVYGFALDDKQWVEFNIDLVEKIVWNDTAFANLILPPDKKAMIQALVEAHQAKDRVLFDDFIIGKGQGLVINLFGPPGVGKTMSAEATSEHLRKPLYVVGAGHLGTDATTLDKSLDEIFDIAYAWNAVVLIDEADVFLEERSVHDIERNALVAVFLSQLEYFAGILFLTTNRVNTFDNAFQSRIHVALRYRDLDEQTRAAIWRAFLGKVGAVDRVNEVQWEALVKKEVNGRQIKNAVRTAQALAYSAKQELSFSHLDQVLGVMEQFESDMKGLKA